MRIFNSLLKNNFRTLSCSLIFIFFLPPAQAQQGNPDSSFGVNGKTIFSVKESSVRGACKQSDDKILQTGIYFDDDNPSNQAILLVRYNKDGAVDTKFGNEGYIITDLSSLGYYSEEGLKVSTDKDGFIYVMAAMKLYTGGIVKSFAALLRYKSTGILDSAFGINGLAFKEFSSEAATAELVTANMLIQPDGNILLNGYVFPDNKSGDSFIYILRFTKDGKSDNSFGDNGMATITAGFYNRTQGIALRGDGKIILAAYTLSYKNYDGNLLMRLLPDGTFDSGFGEQGILKTNSSNGIVDISMHEKNKIVLLGTAKGKSSSKSDLFLAQYNEDGSIDNGFGTSGTTITRIGDLNTRPADLLVDNKNQIIVCGYVNNGSPVSMEDFLLVRYTATGVLDSGFATNGIQTTDFKTEENSFSYDEAQTVMLQNDGNIVLSGILYTDISSYFGLSRYLGDPTHPLITKIKKWIQHHILHFQNPGEDENTAYYVVEESNNQSYGFVPVAKINAGQRDYDYPISSSQTSLYYRIKTVNKDNSFTYTQPIEAISDDAAIISVSPNPATSTIHISGLNADTKYEARILNKEGIAVNTTSYHLSSLNSTINISSLMPGIYFLEIKDGKGDSKSLRFVKE